MKFEILKIEYTDIYSEKKENKSMWELSRASLITNNDKVLEKYRDKLKCIFVEDYRKVLLKTRDFVYDRHILLSHPQASSLKPNQTPYRSVLVYPKDEQDSNMKDVMLIEKCIEVFNQWQEIAKTPKDYDNNVSEDFKTIDLSVIDNIMSRLY